MPTAGSQRVIGPKIRRIAVQKPLFIIFCQDILKRNNMKATSLPPTQRQTAIDQDFHCYNFISKIAGELNYNILVRKMDCMDFLQKTKQDFDIIFADPPYHFEHYQQMKDNIFSNNLVRKDGCLIIEHDSSTNFDEENVELRKYGSVHFSIFTN